MICTCVCVCARYHIEWSESPLSVVEVICGNAVTQLMGEDPQERSSLYPTLSLSTLPSYYRTMLAAMVTIVKGIPLPSKKRPVSVEVSEMEKWIISGKSDPFQISRCQLDKNYWQRMRWHFFPSVCLNLKAWPGLLFFLLRNFQAIQAAIICWRFFGILESLPST